MEKPNIKDYYDDYDPRGMSTSEHEAYMRDMRKWEEYNKKQDSLRNASDSRQIAEDIIARREEIDLELVINGIDEASSKGEFECRFPKQIHPSVKKQLELKGYKIKTVSGRYNETYTIIYWK